MSLPDELIFEILLLLPVISLLRFRCVSKSLCALIDNPNFINSHLGKSSKHKLIFPGNEFYLCDVDLDVEESILDMEKSVSFPGKKVCGYCQGVVFLSRSNLGFSLWNPTTQRIRDLPGSRFYKILAAGLGYDDSVDEYKAVQLVQRRRKLEIEVQVWIFGSKSNVWRKGQNYPFLEHKLLGAGIGHFSKDGSVHWLCTIASNERKSEIVAFDVRNETFYLVPGPVCLENGDPKLHVLKGCLCLSYFYGPKPPYCVLYIRKKDEGDRFTWTKVFTLTETLSYRILWDGHVNVLGYWKKKNKILLEFGMDFMASYDVREERFEDIEADRDLLMFTSTPFLCVESLAPLGGGT